MKMQALILAAAMSIVSATASIAAEHGAMKMEHGGHMEMGGVAHEVVVDGVKATFKVMTMKDAMKSMKMEMPKGMKETHHLSVEFKDTKTGKPLTEGEVKVKVQSPDKSAQTKDLMGMQGHFGADLDLSQKGKYGIMSKFKLKDGKVRSTQFWYEVK